MESCIRPVGDGARRIVFAVPSDKCTCGHGRTAHEHYRAGTECALCPPDRCRAYDGPRRRWWHALIPGALRKKDVEPQTPIRRLDDRRNDGVG